ncbi:universal stress protein [Parafilimonas sp.]|uniref:universal stress protein n=1 Tax=Parafilimonas sp. TaxID=1969739 RepID=UPI003F7DFE6F
MNYKKILIAVDDSPVAEKVALEGLLLGKQLNAGMALISVADIAFVMAEGGVTPREMTEMIKDDLKKVQKMLIKNIFKEQKVWSFIEEGTPADMIKKTCDEWEASLIVIGTHGRTGLSHILMGSVAERVIRHSPVPVLVVPVRK